MKTSKPFKNLLFMVLAMVLLLAGPNSFGQTGPTGPTGAKGTGYKATSTSSVAIGTGSLTFKTQSGLAYVANDRVRVSNSATNFIEGSVTSYTGTSLVVAVTNTSGSGTYKSWDIGIAGLQGTSGATGAAGTTGPAGTAGAKGSTGATGPSGNAGPTGAPGTSGPTGPAGAGLPNGAAAGNTPYWNGTAWVVNSSNIYNNGGNVGIGTTSPGAPLQVNGKEIALVSTKEADLLLENGSAAAWISNGGYTTLGGGIAGLLYMGGASGPDLTINTNNGGVGIGTTVPANTLDIVGGLRLHNSTFAPNGFVFGQDGTGNLDLSYQTATGLFSYIMTFGYTGNVGIGTAAPDANFALSVNGGIICTALQVADTADWPDYVFEKEHPLMPVKELEAFVEKDKHLPGIPTACEIKEKGSVNVGDMQSKMMEKIEESTLYIIQLNKKIEALEEEINALKKR